MAQNKILAATGYGSIRVVVTLVRGKVRIEVQDTTTGKIERVYQQK